MAVPRPGTTEHNRLKDLVIKRLTQSENHMASRHKKWREAEHAYRLFVDPDQLQEPVEPISEHGELLYPYPTSVVVPMTYAIAQTIIAFWAQLFSAQVPYLRIGNRNPESAGAAKAQELVCSYQLDYWGWTPFLYQWFLDTLRYGMGINKCCWKVMERTQNVRSQMQIPILGQVFAVPITEKRTVLEYEGNYNEIIDPYTWRPDPKMPVGQFQNGSFCGEAIYRSYFDLLKKEAEGLYENVRDIPQRTMDGIGARGRSGTFSSSDRERIMAVNKFYGESIDKSDAGMVLVEEGVYDFIPRELGIGESDTVERWIVVLANRAVILRAEEFNYDHQDYLYQITESSPDKHSFLNPGIIEMMEPIAQHISWLYNSHIENVRKAINDVFVVDTDRIEIDDILNPSAGKLIRLKPNYSGTGIDQAIQQLPVIDITKGHIETASVLQDLLQRLSAANDSLQGEQEDTKRTATEVQMATNLAGGRLRMLAKILSAQGITPMARQMVQNNMQYLSQEMYLRLAGSLEQEYQAVGSGRFLQGGVMVSPEDIQGLFDFQPFDSSVPLDPVRYAQTWMQIGTQALQNPAVAPYLDHMALFKQIVHSMGVSDISRFILPQQMQMMQPGQIEQQVQQGNLIEFPGQGNSRPPQPPAPGTQNGTYQ